MDRATSDPEARRPVGVWRRRLLIAYVVLLLASHGVRLAKGRFQQPGPGPSHSVVTVPELAWWGELRFTGREIDLAYLEWTAGGAVAEAPTAEAQTAEGPAVLMVHGSPGSADNFSRIAPLLAERGLRVLAVDLPGFGVSSHQVADYSIRGHAEYCRLLLERLGIDSVHALGFSLGGGVVLHLQEIAPQRVDSLVMLSAIGVQDLELLGNYTINHGVHGAQLALFQAIQELTPHFGLLDRSHVHLSYARNFFDSDQRPLRGLLERYEGPMLILHGRGDVLVPYAAAQEHHRIVPQSRLVSFDANHFMPFRSPEALAEPLVDFLDAVEQGRGVTRDGASPERLTQAQTGERFALPKATGPTLVVLFLLLMVATFVSEDLTCIAAGLLVARGSLGFLPATLACGLGIFLGDLALYAVGRLGRPFLGRAPLRWMIKKRDLARSERWFHSRGPLVILFSRFIPGGRLPTYVGAGLLGMNALLFAFYLLLPVALWTPLLVYASKVAGDRFLHVFAAFEHWALPAFVGFLVGFWILLGLGRSLVTWRGRRLLLGRWRRLTRWEFWPPWMFYPPLVAYLAWLALRHRSATLFTALNPSMQGGGGFVGESKSQILEDLGPEHVAPWRLIPEGPVEQRRARVDAFLEQHDGLPAVLKPDVGQRGEGVVILRRASQIDLFLERRPGPAIVQRFVPGPELGIFWWCRPGQPQGEIFSITDKQLPQVTGDGRSTLEHLVLADSRAIAMAGTYLERLGARLEDVPKEGQEVPLAELGTHCRGAVFLDGSQFKTPELEEAIERIASAYDGFDFGRFDIRAPSYEHFRRGEDLQVLELNGVTSEATHIYDPKHSVFQAWSILAHQWRTAFEIGRHRREQGHRPLSVLELIRLVRGAG